MEPIRVLIADDHAMAMVTAIEDLTYGHADAHGNFRWCTNGARLRFFYQAWRQPLYSLQGGHLLSQALARCGADNILPPGPVAAPLVSPEFVLRENPDILFLSEDEAGESRAFWSRFPSLTAVRERHVMVLDDPRLTRPGPAMLSAVEPVCAQISTWRKRNGVNPR